jgi:hypothetical protein
MTLEPMEAYLRNLVRVESRHPDGLRAQVAFPSDLQGPPDTGHGGGVTSMLVELTRLLEGEAPGSRPVQVEVTLHRGAPLDTPLDAEVARIEGGWHGRILRGTVCLAEATVRPAPAPSALGLKVREEWDAMRRPIHEVPGYDLCLGCGIHNPRGAQVRFDYNEGLVWKQVMPQPHFRAQDGSLYPGYFYVVCDELGWWLGALRHGECGVSNRISITLGSAVPHGTPLLAIGLRSEVTTSDPRGRIWQTRTVIVTPEWEPVASAEVQFVGSRAFSMMMLPRFLPMNDPLAIRRAFPNIGEVGTTGIPPR